MHQTIYLKTIKMKVVRLLYWVSSVPEHQVRSHTQKSVCFLGQRQHETERDSGDF